MSNSIKAPNEKNRSFLIVVIVVVVALIAVIGFTAYSMRGKAVDAPEVNASIAVEGDSIIVTGDKANEDTKRIEIFEDLLCHVCSNLNSQDHDDLTDALNNGDITVEYRFLNFSDQGDVGGSTRGLQALLDSAQSGNAQLFWTLHNTLLENQSSYGNTWKDDDFNDFLSDNGFDGTPSVGNDALIKQAQDIATANATEVKNRIGEVSTPHIFYEGKQINIFRNNKPFNWVPGFLEGNETYITPGENKQ